MLKHQTKTKTLLNSPGTFKLLELHTQAVENSFKRIVDFCVFLACSLHLSIHKMKQETGRVRRYCFRPERVTVVLSQQRIRSDRKAYEIGEGDAGHWGALSWIYAVENEGMKGDLKADGRRTHIGLIFLLRLSCFTCIWSGRSIIIPFVQFPLMSKFSISLSHGSAVDEASPVAGSQPWQAQCLSRQWNPCPGTYGTVRNI